MSAVTKTFYTEQGATFSKPFLWAAAGPVVDGNPTAGAPNSLVGWTARMQIRVGQGTPVIIDATSENGMLLLGYDLETGLTDLTNGIVYILVPATQTDKLVGKKYKYDLEIQRTSDGYVKRLLEGGIVNDLNITQDVGDGS